MKWLPGLLNRIPTGRPIVIAACWSPAGFGVRVREIQELEEFLVSLKSWGLGRVLPLGVARLDFDCESGLRSLRWRAWFVKFGQWGLIAGANTRGILPRFVARDGGAFG